MSFPKKIRSRNVYTFSLLPIYFPERRASFSCIYTVSYTHLDVYKRQTGTFLKGRVFVGDVSYDSGPDGLFPAVGLTASLLELGVSLRRFKTGTPARVLRSSIDFDGLEIQPGEDPVVPFSFETAGELQNQVTCAITWTTPETKQVILDTVSYTHLDVYKRQILTSM